MSESNSNKCDESQNKYKYAVILVTIIMMIFAFGPMSSLSKLQPLTGILYFILICTVIKIIYLFQDNYEPYNILNPRRHNKESTNVDLDSTLSIEFTMISIFISISLLIMFRKFSQ